MRSPLPVDHAPSPELPEVALFQPQFGLASVCISSNVGHQSALTPALTGLDAYPHYPSAAAADTQNDSSTFGKVLASLSYTNHQSTCQYSSPRGEARPFPDAEHTAR